MCPVSPVSEVGSPKASIQVVTFLSMFKARLLSKDWSLLLSLLSCSGRGNEAGHKPTVLGRDWGSFGELHEAGAKRRGGGGAKREGRHQG